MKVVLRQDAPNLGKAGEIREVAESYGRNYLLPRGYAALAPKEIIQQVQKHVTPQELAEAVLAALNNPLDEHVIDDPLVTIPLSLGPAEAELLQKINQGLPSDLGQRYSALIGRRDAEELTPDEYTELLDLTDQVEQFEVQRVEYLVELAHLRNTTVTALIQELGIRPISYV